MPTPNEVLINGERHLIILGQLGNLQSKIVQLEHMMKAGEGEQFLPYLGELQAELSYLVSIYPRLDGEVHAVDFEPRPSTPEVIPVKRGDRIDEGLLSGALRDMRALADAAYTSYTHEGNIPCHLRRMFDRAWRDAADLAGMPRDDLDDIPF